jgi:hypothetical protein
MVDSEQAAKLQKAIPHAALILVSEVGHMVHYFAGDEIVKTADVARIGAAA